MSIPLADMLRIEQCKASIYRAEHREAFKSAQPTYRQKSKNKAPLVLALFLPRHPVFFANYK